MVKLIIALALFVTTTAFAVAQETTASAPIIDFLREQRAIYSTFHIAPIVIPEGEQVGDLIDTDTTVLIAGKADCFDTLSVEQGPSNLLAYSTLTKKGLAAALGVGDIASADADANQGQTYILDYQDVQVERVSTLQFRTRLKKNIRECANIGPYLGAPNTPTDKSTRKSRTTPAASNTTHVIGIVVSDKPPPLLIGTLFKGRRVIKVRLTENIDASAQLSMGAKLLEYLHLGSMFNISAAAGSTSSNTFTIVAKDILPVALVPAYVVTGTRKLANGSSSYTVATVDTDAIMAQIAVAKAIENNSLEDVVAQKSAPPTVLTVNPVTWKFEKHPLEQATKIAKRETYFGSKNDPLKVLFTNRQDIKG